MKTHAKLFRGFTDSPLGRIELTAADEGLVSLYFREHKHARVWEAEELESHPVLVRTRRELAEYFSGKRDHFTVPLAPPSVRGGTPFQVEVWNALLTIPFGETRTYAHIARQIGRASAVRAVGAANGLNSISIVVPCHRVIGSSGALTGYAGGIAAKQWLLAHEAPQQTLRDTAKLQSEPHFAP